MKNLITTILFGTIITAQAQDIIYSREDSLFITETIDKHSVSERKGGELLLAVACDFSGKKYVAETIEQGESEPLVVNTTEVDCTTLVEQTLAIYATIKSSEQTFETVCRNLQKIRYRGGERKGYADRLHYISQWITDSAKADLVDEVTRCEYSRKQPLNLYFMSAHPEKYKMLHGNTALTVAIDKEEKPFRGITVDYIPKELLDTAARMLPVKNGDIIALTTNIPGLDITHIGFAFWEKDRLHLLHASSAAGCVIRDEESLTDYLKTRKRATGIRVFRVK